MESVPYIFCDAVCAVLKDLYAFVEVTSDDSNCGIWKAAAAEAADDRVTIHVDIDYTAGVWSYQILKSAQNEIRRVFITFEELKAINRSCVRTSFVGIGCSYGDLLISTLDEVTEILKYSAPSVNWAEMVIEWDLKITADIVAELLTPFYKSSFSDICVVSYSKTAEDFLRTQLQSEDLKIIKIDDEGWSDELRVSIERFALAKPFKNVDVNNCLVFDLKFLKKLLRKSSRQEWFSFEARFRVKFRKLRKLKKEMQIENNDDTIVWRRTDGTKIQIMRRLDSRLWIKLSCDY